MISDKNSSEHQNLKFTKTLHFAIQLSDLKYEYHRDSNNERKFHDLDQLIKN